MPEFPYGVSPEGIPLTRKGTPDLRWRRPPGSAPLRNAQPPGETRKQQMSDLLSGKPWELVREGYQPDGLHSATGAALKRYFVIRNRESGEELTVGRGEMIKYGGITPPSRRRGRPSTVLPDFEQAFEASAIPVTGA